MITLKYRYEGKDYQGRMGSQLGTTAIGKQYFIKLLPENPVEIILLEDAPVPEYLLIKNSPSEGWKEIPKCK